MFPTNKRKEKLSDYTIFKKELKNTIGDKIINYTTHIINPIDSSYKKGYIEPMKINDGMGIIIVQPFDSSNITCYVYRTFELMEKDLKILRKQDQEKLNILHLDKLFRNWNFYYSPSAFIKNGEIEPDTIFKLSKDNLTNHGGSNK